MFPILFVVVEEIMIAAKYLHNYNIGHQNKLLQTLWSKFWFLLEEIIATSLYQHRWKSK